MRCTWLYYSFDCTIGSKREKNNKVKFNVLKIFHLALELQTYSNIQNKWHNAQAQIAKKSFLKGI